MRENTQRLPVWLRVSAGRGEAERNNEGKRVEKEE